MPPLRKKIAYSETVVKGQRTDGRVDIYGFALGFPVITSLFMHKRNRNQRGKQV